MALQTLPGESEVHHINTEIPHQQGDYIPTATMTRYRIGHYRMQQNGTYLMERAGENVDPETPDAWVIPGVVDVEVPIPQMNPRENLIVANGIYNLVDNDNNPDDIEVEPEEPEVNPNVNRSTLIKSSKTIKTLKLEKDSETKDENSNRISLGQIRVEVPTNLNLEDKTVTIEENGTTEVSPSTGYDGLNTVTINTTVSNNIPVVKGLRINYIFENPYSGGSKFYYYVNNFIAIKDSLLPNLNERLYYYEFLSGQTLTFDFGSDTVDRIYRHAIFCKVRNSNLLYYGLIGKGTSNYYSGYTLKIINNLNMDCDLYIFTRYSRGSNITSTIYDYSTYLYDIALIDNNSNIITGPTDIDNIRDSTDGAKEFGYSKPSSDNTFTVTFGSSSSLYYYYNYDFN